MAAGRTFFQLPRIPIDVSVDEWAENICRELERVAHVSGLDVKLWEHGATGDAIIAAERALRVSLPSEVRAFHPRMNGVFLELGQDRSRFKSEAYILNLDSIVRATREVVDLWNCAMH